MRRRWSLFGCLAPAALLGMGVLAVWLSTGRRVRYGALHSALVVPDSSPSARYRVDRVTLATTGEREISCMLRSSPDVPLHRREASILVTGGRGTGRRAVLLLDSTYTGTALSCEYPWAPLLTPRAVKLLWRLPRLRAELVATPELLRAAGAFLATRREADTTRLLALGASLGVPAVAAWAARDTRPRAVALIYGGAELDRILEATFGREIPLRFLRRPLAWLGGRALAPLEPLHTVGAIAPRPLLVIAGADDDWIPRRSVDTLFALAGEPKRMVWLSTGHMRPTNEELLQSLADTVRAWMKEVFPVAPEPEPEPTVAPDSL